MDGAVVGVDDEFAATHPAQLSKDRPPTNPASQDAADVFAQLDAEDDEDSEA